MKTSIKTIAVLVMATLFFVVGFQKEPMAPVSSVAASEGFFITDQKGEKWNVTQAVSLGFDPKGFQFGIGRNAIVPLDNEALKAPPEELESSERVIGINRGGEAHAYRVRRLNMHEVANTTLGDTAIAAAY